MIWHASFRTVVIAGIAMALVAPLVSCGGDDSGDKVGAQLQEYKIIPDTGDMKTGKIKFQTENVGGSTHEFVVVRADTPESLPTKPDGSFAVCVPDPCAGVTCAGGASRAWA